MARPDDIRITDLAAPVLSPAQRAAIAAASEAPVSLTEDAVIDAAMRRTGLSNFGAADFRERLRVWLASADEDAELNPLGRATVFGNCVRVLANRLRLQYLLTRHPEIHAVEIREPIIIAGLPRSGTTHLVNLISADARLRSLPYWESLEPFPAPEDVPGPDGVDPRLLRGRQLYERQDRILPLLRAMHHMTPEHVHEEIEVQELDFSTYNLEWYARVPRWRDFYLATDQRPHYAYLKTALKALQWLRGPDRWILKSPQHLEQLPALRHTFPDATVVLTHRDPVAVIQSAITMLAYGARIRRTRVDTRDIATYWIDRIERLLSACARDRDVVPASRSVDVQFHEFMADDVAMVERIYAVAGLPMARDAVPSRRVYGREPAGPVGAGDLRPAGRLRRRAGGPAPAVRLLPRPIRGAGGGRRRQAQVRPARPRRGPGVGVILSRVRLVIRRCRPASP